MPTVRKVDLSSTSCTAAAENAAPWSDAITAYDRAHLFLYARLLDAAANDVSDAEMIRDILDLDPGTDEAAESLAQHLTRARWMREIGYRQMLSQADQEVLSRRR